MFSGNSGAALFSAAAPACGELAADWRLRLYELACRLSLTFVEDPAWLAFCFC